MNQTEKNSIYSQRCTNRAWIELNMENLKKNIHSIQKLLPPGCEIMAVLKDNAYGHGDTAIAAACSAFGIRSFAAATLSEGIRLRESGVTGEILILGFTPPEDAHMLYCYRMTQTVVDADYAKELDAYGFEIPVHVKIDTGMHRIGEDYRQLSRLIEIYSLKHLKVTGTYTHLCTSDCLDEACQTYAGTQIDHFYQAVDGIRRAGFRTGRTHIQSSYGILNYPSLKCDYVRAGILLYGAHTVGNPTRRTMELAPVLSLRSRIVSLKTLAPGENAGYGCTYTAPKTGAILATATIGYGDGLPRNLSCGQGFALVRGVRVPIVSRICMDSLTLDVSAVPQAAAGDIATFIGKDGPEEITALELSTAASTIAPELLGRLGPRLERIILSADSPTLCRCRTCPLPARP